MTIKAVFFDVGETLVDKTRHWGLWAGLSGLAGGVHTVASAKTPPPGYREYQCRYWRLFAIRRRAPSNRR